MMAIVRSMLNGGGRFPGFPAGSLPSPRFLPYVMTKPMIELGFSVSGEVRKNF
jgi:hypothetical protein